LEAYTGKVPVALLEKYVFVRTGVRDSSVLLGPAYGEDAAIIDVGGGTLLVVHSDPITAASELAGWLAVHVPSNDVAVRGARPRWLSAVLLLPEGFSEALLDELTWQMDKAAREVGVAIVGGHTEAAPGLERPIISVTAMGTTDRSRVVVTSGARPGDVVVMTKTAAVEGTAIVATDFADELLRRGVPEEIIASGRRFIERVSVVREALALAERGLATSMHDPTEGGVLGGVAEIAYASRTRIVVYEERIPVAEETRAMADALGVDPLKLISSGTLVATVPRDRVDEALEALRIVGVEASVIGEVVEKVPEGTAEVVRRDGRRERLPKQVVDEIYRLTQLLS
jgi:thiamin-phosphate kinase